MAAEERVHNSEAQPSGSEEQHPSLPSLQLAACDRQVRLVHLVDLNVVDLTTSPQSSFRLFVAKKKKKQVFSFSELQILNFASKF